MGRDQGSVNCDQCKEQVLELIEREAIDPEGVREVLAKCPDCRKMFDELKATLVVAQRLPLEAPPDHLDIPILQAAEARAKVAVPRPSAGWRQQLAMAAVALLVVGIGVSTVSIVRAPREEQLAKAPVPAAEDADEALEVAAPSDSEKLAGQRSADLAVAEATVDQAATPEPEAAKPAASRRASASRPQAAKKKEPRKASGQSAPSVAQEEELRQFADDEAGAMRREAITTEPARVAKAAPEADRDDMTANEPQVDEKRRCSSTISAFEKRAKDDDEYLPLPEEELSLGLCYQLLGKRNHAEHWLRRAAEHPSTSARAEKALEELQ